MPLTTALSRNSFQGVLLPTLAIYKHVNNSNYGAFFVIALNIKRKNKWADKSDERTRENEQNKDCVK
jgi:hypothetical protein